MAILVYDVGFSVWKIICRCGIRILDYNTYDER